MFLNICALKVIYSLSITEETQTFKFIHFFKLISITNDNLT